MRVSSLYIAQAKAKHGIIERDCCNKPELKDNRVPKCPPVKEKAVEDDLRHFRMINHERADDKGMHEALYRFIHAHYTEILAVFPVILLLIGLSIATGIDQYILRWKRRIMLIMFGISM